MYPRLSAHITENIRSLLSIPLYFLSQLLSPVSLTLFVLQDLNWNNHDQEEAWRFFSFDLPTNGEEALVLEPL